MANGCSDCGRDAMMQRIIFQDILDPKWQQFRTTEEAIAELEQAGFDEIEIIPDRSNIFPTVIAYKSAGG